MHLVYSLLTTLAALLGLPYWLLKALREKKYWRSTGQRLGLKLPDLHHLNNPIWIHSVSVGEVLAAKPLVSALRGNGRGIPVVLSTVTLTGNAMARKEIETDSPPFYFPFDWNFCVRRFLDCVRPRAVVLMETELWPNFLENCHARDIPVFMANGRLSNKSFSRYRRIPGLTKCMLNQVRIFGVQTHEDRKRFLDLGAPENRIHVTGNLKFDFPPTDLEGKRELLEGIRSCLGLQPGTPLIVVGSSMKGEEAAFLAAFRVVKHSLPDARMILAPRHPERFGEVAAALERAGWVFRMRSRIEEPVPPGGAAVLLLDSIGELRAVYSLATVAVIGGSFLPFGGHNILEPAAFGKAIVFGPHMSNFAEMARVFLRGQAARQETREALGTALIDLLSNPKGRDLLGHRALSTLHQHQGAAATTAGLILEAI